MSTLAAQLLDADSFAEDGRGSGGVVTGIGTIDGRPVAVLADDATATDSWDAAAVERVLRLQEQALARRVPVVALLGPAGTRLPEQLDAFAGRRGAGRILHNLVRMSGVVPQVCALFGTDAGGATSIPAFCDLVIGRDHAPNSAHVLVADDAAALAAIHRYLSFLPSQWEWRPPIAKATEPASAQPIREIVPADARQPVDMRALLEALVDGGSLFEIGAHRAPELIAGFARLKGWPLGIVANQPTAGAGATAPGVGADRQSAGAAADGALSAEAAAQAARFVTLCTAFGVPLLFLADVPGFSATHADAAGPGAQLIGAVAATTAPTISVIVRRADGAGLYAMGGPALEPDCCLALPTASIAADRERAPGANAAQLAAELVVDAVVEPEHLRAEVARRFALLQGKRREWPDRRTPILPG